MTATSTQPSEVATAALDTRPLARHWRMPHSELLAELVAEGSPGRRLPAVTEADLQRGYSQAVRP